MTSLRDSAVGLAGVAPRLVSSRGRSALIPDASGLLFVHDLRAALAPGWCIEVVGWTCCSLQRTTLFSLSRSARTALRLVACVLAAVCEP
ncbi:hypothetical protein [Ottowia thiooxydans]|uniref:hypothetical protein n=1 Tax=Ottowia thiooxydans TaxID=219182 RepID=UPI00146D85B6|nr:hypothetical protein [Ottowia thiooxydans]